MTDKLKAVGIDTTVNLWTVLVLIFAAGAMYYRVQILDAKMEKFETRLETFNSKNIEAHFEITKELADTRATVRSMQNVPHKGTLQ